MAEQNGATPQDRGRLYSTPLDTATVQPVPLEMLEALASTWDEEEERERKVRGRGQGQGRASGEGGGGTASASASTSTNGRLTADIVLPEGFNRNRVYERARRYLARVDPAVSGQRGHDATYRAVCVLVVRFNLTVNEAYPLLAEWNARCDPPWDDSELWRKLREADEKETGPRGEFLRGLLREVRREAQRLPANGGEPPPDAAETPESQPQTDCFRNYYEDDIDDRTVRIGYSIDHLGQELRRLTGGWPKRVGEMLFAAQGHQPLWLKSPSSLFAWIGRQIPTTGRLSNVLWAQGPDKVTQAQFFDYLKQTAEDYQAVERYPHEPPLSGHYYLCPSLRERSDGSALAELLAQFSPASSVDAQLIKGFLMTLIWGGPPGQRPSWVFTAADDDAQGGRGVGKSTVAQFGAELVGGCINLGPNEKIEDIHKRILSPLALESRVALIDNIKNLRFSWPDLEALITGRRISGRQLHTGEGRRPGTLVWVMTFNGASFSKDMSQRSIVVKMDRPRYTARWVDDTHRMIESRRWDIISDLVAALRRPAQQITIECRWGTWEQAILARLDDPAACQREILMRQEEVDDDREEMEVVRDAFREWIRSTEGRTPETDHVLIPPPLAAAIVNDATGERRANNRAMIYLYRLGVPEIRKSKAKNRPGCIWRGKEANYPTARLAGRGHEASQRTDEQVGDSNVGSL